MGNNQSTLSDDRRHKLTKPKTNSTSSHFLCISRPPPSSSGSSVGPVRGSDNILEEDLGTEQERNTDDLSKTMGGSSGSSRDRLSRNYSVMSHFASAMASSTLLNSSTGGSRLSLKTERSVAELSSSAELLEEIQAKASKDELVAQIHKLSTNDGDTPPIGPIRRRSLLTPGIATRCSTGNILRKPPPPENLKTQEDHDYYFNPAYPETSPLGRLAALGLPLDRPDMPKGRSATPCDLDYSHLCGLKPGTLRVTNGAATPDSLARVAAPAERGLSPESHLSDQFFSASEGGRGLDADSDKMSMFSEKQDMELEPSIVEQDCSGRVSYSVSSSPDPASAIAQEYINELALAPSDYFSMDSARKFFDNGNISAGEKSGCFSDEAIALASPSQTQVRTFPPLVSAADAATKRLIKTDSGYGSEFSVYSYDESDSNYGSVTRGIGRISQDVDLGASNTDCPCPTRPAPCVPLTMSGPVPQIESGENICPRLDVEIIKSSIEPSQSSPSKAQRGRSPARKLQKSPRQSRSLSRKGQAIPQLAPRDLSPVEVPPVPLDVAAKHAKRLDTFPALDHTFPSLEDTRRSDTPDGPISSIASFTFPEPGQELSELPPHRMASSSLARGAVIYDAKDAFLGNTNMLLGASPYDVARPASWADVNQESIRCKSMIGMDAESASRMARERSIERNSRNRTSINFSRPRPRSLHGSQFDDRGGIPGRAFRPRSLYDSVPPLPALPGQKAPESDVWSGQSTRSSKHRSLPVTDVPNVLGDRALPRLPSEESKDLKTHPTVVQDWEAVKGTWRQRRKSVGEALTKKDELREIQPDEPITQEQELTWVDMAVGRFEGGLGYGYEPDKRSTWGSAGFAPRNSKYASRKSVELSKAFGVDLSDVPVFIMG